MTLRTYSTFESLILGSEGKEKGTLHPCLPSSPPGQLGWAGFLWMEGVAADLEALLHPPPLTLPHMTG